MQDFVVSLKIYRPSQSAIRRLLRPSTPAVEYSERWVHIVVHHPDPAKLVQARPDRVVAGGLSMPTRGATWTWDAEHGIWDLQVTSETEQSALALPALASWASGRYSGPSLGQPYRS